MKKKMDRVRKNMTSTKKNLKRQNKRNSKAEEYLLRNVGERLHRAHRAQCSRVICFPSPDQNTEGKSYATDAEGKLIANQTMDVSPRHHENP